MDLLKKALKTNPEPVNIKLMKGTCKGCGTKDAFRFNATDLYTCKSCKTFLRRHAHQDRKPADDLQSVSCERCGLLPVARFKVSNKTGLYYPKCEGCRTKKSTPPSSSDEKSLTPERQSLSFSFPPTPSIIPGKIYTPDQQIIVDHYLKLIPTCNIPREHYPFIVDAYTMLYTQNS